MNQIIDKYEKKGLNIVAVSIDGRKEAALKFLEENPANFEILFDTDSQMLVQFGVRVVPSSFILDDKGNLLYSHLGFSSKDKPELEKVIKKFLEIK
jgi:peroxiredoxin